MADQIEFVREFEVFNVEGFKAQIEKLTKRYKVQFSVIPGSVVSRTEENCFGVFDYSAQKMSVVFTVPGYKIEGFDYLGCIKDEGVEVMTIHGSDKMGDLNVSTFVKEMKSIPCHNCNKKHIRKIGHIFMVRETGEFIVFGSSCAKNYFGLDFVKILSMFERVKIGVEDWDGDARYSHFSSIVDFEKVSKLAYYIIGSDKFHPYTSNIQAENRNTMSTSDMVKDVMSRPADYQKMIALDPEFWESIDIDFSEIAEYPFTDKIGNLSTFEHNVQAVQEKIRLNCVGASDIGLLTWMVNKVYFTKKEDKVVYVLPSLSKGDKIVSAVLTLDHIHEYQSSYGLQKIYTFIDIDNKVRYKWFTSVNIKTTIPDLEIGMKVLVKAATVKELEDDPKYGKSVIITRAKVEAAI